LRLAVAGLAVYFDFSAALIEDLKLAVTEGYRHALATARGASRVRVLFDVSGEQIVIDMDADAPRTATSADDAEVSLFVLRALVDEVSVGGAERYHLTMTKALG
jgi:hypothetical protein